MLNFLKNEANKTFTENSAVTYASTCSDCLDLFATIGALRRERDGELIGRSAKAYAEDSDLAMKMQEKQELAMSLKYTSIIAGIIPMMIAYPFVQKYFVRGVMVGAIKG